MAREEKEKYATATATATAGLGTGGKFNKRPFRGNHETTPYDRLRNRNRKSGWLWKLVDDAHGLMTYSAHSLHSLFSSLFRKRLPPPPSEGGITELEELLMQKTFSRSEIDHLKALIRSRIVDAPVREEEKKKQMDPSEPMLTCGQRVTPHVASAVELAKAYMRSRPSKVSSSILREDPTLLKSKNLPLKSPIMSIVPKARTRTPYARIHPASTLKGGGLAVEGEPSSSTRSALDHDMLSGPNKGTLKRTRSILDNDIGSYSPIRRMRHKYNLLYSNGAFSSFSPVEKEIICFTTMAEKTTSGMKTIAQENSSALSLVMPSKSFTKDGEARVGTADGSMDIEMVDVSTCKASYIPDPTFKPATITTAIQTSFGSNKPASSNRSITNPPLFNVGNKVVWSTKSTATAAPSKEITKSGSIFSMEKVVSSKEPGADAPLVNFGTNGNVFKVPPMPFTASSSVSGESASLKFGASSESKLGSSIRYFHFPPKW